MEKYSGIVYELDLDSQENMVDFLYELGVDDAATIDWVVTAPCTVTLTVDGDDFTQCTTTCCYEDVVCYRLDEEFDQLSYDGRVVRSVVKETGPATHYQEEEFDDDTVFSIEKHYSAHELVMVLKIGDVTAKRIYRAVGRLESPSQTFRSGDWDLDNYAVLQADGA